MVRQPRVSLVQMVYALSCAGLSRAQNNATASNVGQPDWKPGHPVYIQAPLPDNGAGGAPAVGYTCDQMHSSLGPILLCSFVATQSYNAYGLGAIKGAVCLQTTICTSFSMTFTRSLGARCGCGLVVPLAAFASRACCKPRRAAGVHARVNFCDAQVCVADSGSMLRCICAGVFLHCTRVLEVESEVPVPLMSFPACSLLCLSVFFLLLLVMSTSKHPNS